MTLYHKINLLYVINSLTIGGAERLLISIVKKLDKKKYNCIICTLRNINRFPSYTKGIKIVSLNLNKYNIYSFFLLVKLIKKEKIKIVHTHLIPANIIGTLAAWITKVPIVVYTIHSSCKEIENKGLISVIYKILFRFISIKIDKIIVVSSSAKKSWQKWNFISPKIELIYNGTDLFEQKKEISSQKVRNFSSGKNVALIGRITSGKGHDIFLKAAKIIIQKEPEVIFLIIGECLKEKKYKEKLLSQTRQFGLDKRVFFVGNYENIVEWIDICEVVVQASTSSEAFGMVIIEAMARGKPVVATYNSTTLELIEHNLTGLIVPPNDEKSMAEAIIKFLRDDFLKEKITKLAFLRVKTYFSLEKTIKNHERIYEQLLKIKL